MFYWQEQIVLTQYKVGISQKQSHGPWDAFTANVDRPELSQVGRCNREEIHTGLYSSAELMEAR